MRSYVVQKRIDKAESICFIYPLLFRLYNVTHYIIIIIDMHMLNTYLLVLNKT